MSVYTFNTLTVDGTALIAQATAANPIVMVGSLSKATAASSASDLAVKGKSWYDGKPGAIAAAAATASVARIVAVYRNSGTRQAAKSICITARLASQTDADAVVLCAMSDPDATVELPGADDTGQGVEIPFNIAINAADTIQATPGASASLADLERFVSLHAAGNPSQGERQHIYGWKIFRDDVSVRGGLSAHTVTSYRSSGGGPLLTIDPDDGDYGVFSTSMRVNFNALAITDANTGDTCVSIDRTDTSQDAGLTVNVPAYFNAITTTDISKDANQLADANKKLDITLFCGTQEDDYSVKLRLSYGQIGGVVNYALTLIPDNLAYSKTTSIGTPANRLSTVYASDLDGRIPRPGANPPDVGSIFLACVPTPGSNKAAGTTVTATPGNPIYYAAVTTTGSGGNYSVAINMGASPIETGTYTLLNAINPPSTGPAQAVALVMRTA